MYAVSDQIVELSSQTMRGKAAKWKGCWWQALAFQGGRRKLDAMFNFARSNYMSKYESRSISYFDLNLVYSEHRKKEFQLIPMKSTSDKEGSGMCMQQVEDGAMEILSK